VNGVVEELLCSVILGIVGVSGDISPEKESDVFIAED
jgi:hypothetical protein